MTSYADSLLEHYRTAWAGSLEKVPFDKGPIGDLPVDFAVMICPPHGSRTLWTYATLCMSQPTDSEPIEVHLFSNSRADQLAELLFAIAHYHRTGSPLGVNHSVNFGRPWFPGSTCDHGLISLPYLDGPKLEWAEIESRSVRFLWVIPITTKEFAFKQDKGIQALEERFEKAHVAYADPFRPSVA